MKRWDHRPFEVRNLFNPAFCGLILFRALQGFEEENVLGMPFSLSFLVLPVSLHKDTRNVLAQHSRSYLLKTVERNPGILVGFSARASHLVPFTLEAFGLLLERGCFSVSEDGRLRTIAKRVRKSITGTDESIACQTVARSVGKEFARIGDRATIYTTFGVRP